MTLKYNRAPLLSNIKLYASFHHHMWIQTGVTVRKRLSWVVTSVTLTFDLWPWLFAWTLHWSLVITAENFMMIRWWEHSQKGVTDGQKDRKYHSQSCLVPAKNNHVRGFYSVYDYISYILIITLLAISNYEWYVIIDYVTWWPLFTHFCTNPRHHFSFWRDTYIVVTWRVTVHINFHTNVQQFD